MLGKQISNLFLLKKEGSGNHWDNVYIVHMYACKYVFYIAACLTYVTLAGLQWNAEHENLEQPSIIQPIKYTARSQGLMEGQQGWDQFNLRRGDVSKGRCQGRKGSVS